MEKNLITHIQEKINSLKNEIKSIQYTNDDGYKADNYVDKVNECVLKIQVLNEVIMSFGVQK